MKQPVLDPRDRRAIMAQVAAHARSYTPEWRYEGAEDDPGSALAELFGDLFYQTVDRMNSVPGKLHTEFLNLTGFRMPDPVPAAGLLQYYQGGRLVVINRDATPADSWADLVIRNPIGQVLGEAADG